MTLKQTLGFVAATGVSLLSYGAGYQIIEQGAANMGTAMAGATANANNDASAAFWNPSAVAYMPLEVGKTRIDSVINAVIPTLTFVQDGTHKSYSCAANEIVPNFYAVHRFTEDLYATLSITAPCGLESFYDYDWFGQYTAIRSYLFTTDINPSIAYKITDWFSISGGVSAQFAYCTLNNSSPYGLADCTGQSWSIGGNIGFAVEYCEGGKFGFQWRSAVDHTLSGGMHINDVLQYDISADMHMPETFTAGIYQKLPGIFDQFAIMAEYSFSRWSVFDRLVIEGAPLAPVEENWKDTSRVAVGIHYYPNYIKDLTLRLGVSFDESPVRSSEYRTARIPCSDRLWYSAGVGYKYGPFTFDLAYTYVDVLGGGRIDEAGPMPALDIVGHYYAHIHVISAQIGYEF